MAGRSWEDSDYMPEVHGATQRGAHRFAHILLVVIVSFFIVFFFWARSAQLDEVTRGEGQVIPSGQVQVVQNLEGGIVAAINVREGELVEKGQVLLKIDNVTAASDLREGRARELALSGLISRTRRLTVIANLITAIGFSPVRCIGMRRTFAPNLISVSSTCRDISGAQQKTSCPALTSC